jgi:hypothetical protein
MVEIRETREREREEGGDLGLSLGSRRGEHFRLVLANHLPEFCPSVFGAVDADTVTSR